ncbi:SoxR reducing system RseC family protein [Chitinilyticum litopenaei]|uniref:SoxR reducing system RseC family protein n=1 Tax=Chitinilyticum litopenaei TaxID=1121276 RepID=UPI0003F5AB65|nr:SoxR reducing system RseC family protein [Chitinilyticum litopenaei]
MIETEAQVERLDGERAWVRLRPHSPCGHCDPVTGCKSVAISRMFGNARQEFSVRSPLPVVPGDLVVIAIPEPALLHSALWGYGLPLALLLLGAGFGGWLAGDAGALTGAASGLVLAFVLLWLRRKQTGPAEPFIARVGRGACGSGACASTCAAAGDRHSS